MVEIEKRLVIVGITAAALGLLVGGLIGHFATPTEEIIVVESSTTAKPIQGTETTTEIQGETTTTTEGIPATGMSTTTTEGITVEEIEEIVQEYTLLTTDQWLADLEDGVDQWIMNEIKTENLEANLRILSAEPHLASTPRDEFLAQFMKDKFLEYGFDWAEMLPYDLYLSRPNSSDPNLIRITSPSDTANNFTSTHREQFDEEIENFVDAFNAFTPAGNFEYPSPGAGIVYVNYGSIEDFEMLASLGVDITGCIALMRYGFVFRGNKIQNAAAYGAQAAILFSDPADVALEGQDPEDVYPHSRWLPESGIQRGYAFLGQGDPLTPGWPSTEFAHRINPEDGDFVGIPAQPIGYGDAQRILEMLGGDEAPADWQGGLNMVYRLGPQFLPEFADYTPSIETHNYEDTFTSYNVFGTIQGSVEPDRYVLIGNHRDAWGFGASDPSSGTSQLLETARVLGLLMQERNWRPRRTLVFCSWGAEEYGLIGSTEWVEEQVDKLQGRAVAYINTDTCSTGSVLEVPSSPLLWDMSMDIIKRIPGVSDPSKTVYDEMMEFQESYYPAEVQKPRMTTLGSGSDYAHFFIYAGVPAMDVWFRRNRTEFDISIYASYHTGFETFEMVANHTDPGFKYTQGCGRVASLIIKMLSDSLILPFNLTNFPKAMSDSLAEFGVAPQAGELSTRDKILTFYPEYVYLEDAVANLTVTTQDFHTSIEGREFTPMEVRTVNDQLMKFEQTFIIPQGLPGRQATRHAVFAPSQFDNYATAGFPGILDLMYDYDDLTGQELLTREEEIRQHVSLLTILTNRAAGILLDVHTFMPH